MKTFEFIRADTAQATRAVADAISSKLRDNQPVLWLVSGGSNVQTEVDVMQLLRDQAAEHLRQLTILPMDERFGAAGHADSNTASLSKAGFDPGFASWIDILAANVPLAETVAAYGQHVSDALETATTVIGQLGLGNDGHIAGVLPGSPAVHTDEPYVTGYEWTDYTRMTLTPQALSHISIAFVLALGDGKEQALERLTKHSEPVDELPAVLLHDIPEVYVYNSVIESE
jgi:6-phosphogluconolactonase/glucosamine-6-phosphate isomerase/deaminase